MSISLDVSASGVVVFCTDCQHWTRGASSMLAGHEIAAEHEQNVHDGAARATNNAHAYRARHAARATTIRRK